MSLKNVQTKIEELLTRPAGTILKKPSELGLPKVADGLFDEISVITTSRLHNTKGFSLDLSWKGKTVVYGLPGVSLKNNPAQVTAVRTAGGGLILKSADIQYKNAPIEVILHGNIYQIKGNAYAYTF